MNNYKSSIITKYGDSEKVKEDSKTLFDIISRQGSNLLTDCLAEYVGNAANKFNLCEQERAYIIESLSTEFNEALRERL